MKKIRFVNPIKECVSIQGKTYTICLISTIAACLALSIVGAMFQMPIYAAICGIIGVACIIGFGWWFGTETVPEEE